MKLEAPGTPDNVSQDDSETGEGGGGERGERVHGEIAVLSPSQRPSAVTPTSSGVPTVPESGVVSDEATSVKHEKSPRPDELNIKTFVPSKHLPTPSREAALTQKLEQALGM